MSTLMNRYIPTSYSDLPEWSTISNDDDDDEDDVDNDINIFQSDKLKVGVRDSHLLSFERFKELCPSYYSECPTYLSSSNSVSVQVQLSVTGLPNDHPVTPYTNLRETHESETGRRNLPLSPWRLSVPIPDFSFWVGGGTGWVPFSTSLGRIEIPHVTVGEDVWYVFPVKFHDSNGYRCGDGSLTKRWIRVTLLWPLCVVEISTVLSWGFPSSRRESKVNQERGRNWWRRLAWVWVRKRRKDVKPPRRQSLECLVPSLPSVRPWVQKGEDLTHTSRSLGISWELNFSDGRDVKLSGWTFVWSVNLRTDVGRELIQKWRGTVKGSI